MLKNLIRGGQTNIHQVRMFKQIVWVGFLVSLGVSLGVGFYSQRIPLWVWKKWIYGKFLLESSPYLDHRIYKELMRVWKTIFPVFWMSYGVLWILWVIKGYFTRKDTHIRGSAFVSLRRLRFIMRRRGLISPLRLDKLPLVKDKETSHILITGTTGSGKTNCLHKLIPQIINQKGIIVDLTGDFVHRYYDPTRDHILNPFDERSKHWSPWRDMNHPTHYDAFAKSIVPSSNKTDPFWDQASRTLLATALEKTKTLPEFLKILLSSNIKTLEKFFKGTRAANIVSADSEKTTASILSNLSTHLASFVYLKEGGFSIREWVKKESKGFLFLTATPDQRETLRPLITAWVESVLNSLMSLPPNHKRRFWIIMDELPALNKLSSLTTALSESRKYGGCLVAGIQSVQQLEDIYGYNLAASLLDNFNTKIFFRAMNPDTAKWISRVLGSYEQKEVNENVSYGANTMRDGVNLSDQIRTHPLVREEEIMQLKDLEAYIKLPEGLPVTKVKMGVERGQKSLQKNSQ